MVETFATLSKTGRIGGTDGYITLPISAAVILMREKVRFIIGSNPVKTVWNCGIVFILQTFP